MVKYFKELENPNSYYLDLINTRLYNKTDIDLRTLPLEFFEKYNQLFLKIEKYDLLYEINKKEKKLYLDDCLDIDLEWAYSSFVNGHGLEDTHLSKNGIDKINSLKREYSKRYTGIDFIEDFEIYFMAIYDQFLHSDNGIMKCSKNRVYDYLSSAKIMAKYQDKLSKDDEILFDDALDYIKKYKVEIPHKDFEPVRMYLPNSWYITPYNHLYNTMGPNGHKEANLIYPLYYRVIRDDNVFNPYGYLQNVKKILEQGFIDKATFDHYTNLIYDFSTIYPENYYNFTKLNKIRYNAMHKRTYNPKIVKLVAGIESAHAGLFSFFYYLKNNSCDYYSDLDYIKQFDLDEILVRCCGFHKISSICDKTITTSCVNYEEQFEEYINKGWTIDFVKPIILDPYTKRLQEYSDEILLIKRMHCHK